MKVLPLMIFASANELLPFRNATRFVQFGAGRTATTLQWASVTAYICALGLDARVSKTHNLEYALLMAKRGSPLFVTHQTSQNYRFDVPESFQKGDWRKTRARLEKTWKLPENVIVYVQETALVAMHDWRIILDYAAIFGQNDNSTAVFEVVEFMRLWSILRRCCGPQMSAGYRARLYDNAFKARNKNIGPGNIAYDACELYNISAVELSLVNTALFKRCPSVRSILQSGIRWAKLNGTFCKRYEVAAKKAHSKFNENPFLQINA